ncbi:HAD family hydrolase [Arthrobacter tumbae]|uniref:HAD family hydrolase n=1 Tax=Arthrobacter tumbae TaxID=163874 RepID=UPI0027DB3FCD|nr:HAD family phosphatase [Arthrobacter tumbae]MBM7781836.1 putative hydrolase of the HAD superfamily [Arthrobacter tumbae]
MIKPDDSRTWYLFDYGMVISTAPEPDDWDLLQEATGIDLQVPNSAYWTNRERFDAGDLEPLEYWSRVVGRQITDQFTEVLESLDASQWSHLNLKTMSVLEALVQKGSNLALLSNMPAGMSRRFLAEAPWTKHFSRTFFSGQLGMTKPDRRVFKHVLDELHARAEDSIFIDDNALNIDTAQALGIRTVAYSPGTNLHRALNLP